MKTTFTVAAVVAVACLLAASLAFGQTQLVLTIKDQSGVTTNLYDGGAGYIYFLSKLAGSSLWGGANALNIYADFQDDNNTPEIDLDIQGATSTGAGSLTFTLTELGWPSQGYNLGTVSLAMGGAGDNGSISASGLVNGSSIGLNSGPLTTNPWSTNLEANASGFVSTFSLGETVVLVHSASGVGKEGDIDLTVIPEPSALVLAAFGIGGLLLIRRRK